MSDCKAIPWTASTSEQSKIENCDLDHFKNGTKLKVSFEINPPLDCTVGLHFFLEYIT